MDTDIHNLDYAEQMLAAFQRDPASIPAEWRRRFEKENDAEAGGEGQKTLERTRWRPGPSFAPRNVFNGGDGQRDTPRPPPPALDPLTASLHERVNELIRNYRVRGHKIAAIDPLGALRPTPAELQLDYYGFTERELELFTVASTLPYDTPLRIREIIERLRNTYCRSIGAQFMHIDALPVRAWLQRRMESAQNRLALPRALQLRILTRLTDAVMFEEFMRKQFAPRENAPSGLKEDYEKWSKQR